MLRELLECLGGVADPRAVPRTEHRLIDVLAIAVCAVLAGAESFEDIALYGRSKRAWLSRFLELPNGVPSHDTFRRVLVLIDPEAFEQGFLAWTRRAFVTGVRRGRGWRRGRRRAVADRGGRQGAATIVRPQAREDAAAPRRRLRDEKRPHARAAARGRARRRARGAGGAAGRIGRPRRADQPGRRLLPPERGRGDRRARRRPPDRAQGQRPRPARRGAGLVRRARLRGRGRAAPVLGQHGWRPRPGRRAGACSWPTRPRCPGPTTSSPPGRTCAASSPWRPSASWRTPRRARRAA